MINVAICTPTAGQVQAAYAVSLTSMVVQFLSNPILGLEKESRGIQQQLVIGANIGQNRDNMVDTALATGCTHILFIDDDMGFAPDCLSLALCRQQPVVLANYRRKTPPCQFTATKMDKDENVFELLTTKDSTSLEECYYGGFGFCLISAEVLQAIPKPRFMMYWVPQCESYTTEDKPFFEQVHKAGFPVFIDQELSKRVWHVGPFNYQWSDNVPAYKATNPQ